MCPEVYDKKLHSISFITFSGLIKLQGQPKVKGQLPQIMEELKNQIAKGMDRDERRTGKMVLQFIYHIGSFTKTLENKLRSHRHYAFYPHESFKSGIQIFLAIAISLYKEDNECTIFTSNRKKL